VDHISFSLEQREILGLIGPNGSGKTTSVNVITGLLKPSDGQVLVDGARSRRRHTPDPRPGAA